MSKLALVTGGTRGIGEAISIALKEFGYTVIANYAKNDQAALEFAHKHKIEIKKWDVSDYQACRDAIVEIEQHFSDNISVLINNAGINKDKMFHKMRPEDWNLVIDTNLLSCFNMSHVVINQMREKNYGRIINISSINGQVGQTGQTNYSAAKAGIIGFTKALARESCSKNITVNCVAPGYIMTQMISSMSDTILNVIKEQIPLKRLGLPEEIARAVIFLADEKAGFITGETLSVNGGHYMC